MSGNLPLALGTLLLVTACAAPRVPLKPEARAEIAPLDSVLILPRGTHTAPAACPGLFSPAPTRPTPAAPAGTTPTTPAAAPAGNDTLAVLQQAWRSETAGSEIRFSRRLRVEDLTPDEPAGRERMRLLFDNASGAAVLFARIGYTLCEQTLRVTAQVEIYPRAPALLRFRHSPDVSDPLAEGSVIFRQQFAEERPGVSDAAAGQALDEALHGIVRKIVAGLNARP